jgi:hypothetical protein
VKPFPLLLALTAVIAWTGSVQAQKPQKKPGLPPGDLFFTMKGQPFALERVFPGVQAALLLSEEQQKKLAVAREETVGSELVRNAGKKLKGDPKATAAQKEEARKLIEEARAKLLERAADVLTTEQRVLADRINTAAAEALQAVREKFEAEFTAAKGNKEAMEEVNKKVREEAQGEFGRMLENLLTPEQRKAVGEAAKEQKKAEKVVKPGK